MQKTMRAMHRQDRKYKAKQRSCSIAQTWHPNRTGTDKTRQDKTRLCHIHSNPSSQGGGQVLEKRNSCTDTCMTRRLVVNSWQMPLAIKPAQASRHATCHFTHYRPANAAIQCLRFLSRLNVRFDVLRDRNVCKNVCTKGRDPQADRCRTKLAKVWRPTMYLHRQDMK